MKKQLAHGFFWFSVLIGVMTCIGFGHNAQAAAHKIDPNSFGGANRLNFYHDKGTLKSVDISGISGSTQFNVNKEEGRYIKDVVWDKPNKVTKTSKITAHFQSIASYNGKDLNCDVILSDFTNSHRSLNSGTSNVRLGGKNYYEFVRFTNNLYNGVDIQGFGAMNLQLNFTYSSNHQPLNLEAPSGDGRNSQGSYLTLACLDGNYHQRLLSFEDGKGIVTNYVDHKEFTGYQKMGSLPYYLTNDTALGEYAPPMKSANNLCNDVLGGRAEKGYSTDDHFSNAFGSPTYNRSGVTYTLQGTNPQFMIGTNIYSMYFSFTTASIWSKFPPAPSKETYKQAKTDVKDQSIDRKYIAKGSDVYYHVKQSFGQIGTDQLTEYSGFKVTDTFDGSKLDYVNHSAKLLYKSGNSWQEVDGKGDYTVSGNKLTYTASGGFLSDKSNYGKTFVLELHFTTKKESKGILKNTAQTTFNNVYTQSTNTVESYFLNDPTKTVTQNGHDVNGHNKGEKGTPTGPLNLGSIVQYGITQKWHTKGVDTDNDHYTQFSIQDTLDKNLTYQEGSAKVIDQSTGNDISSEGKLSYNKNSHTIQWTASAPFLSKTPLDGRDINLIFNVKTPFVQTLDIRNTGNTVTDLSSASTNETIIGVKRNFPVLIIPRTGSHRLASMLLISGVFLTLGLGGIFWNKR